MSTKKWVWAIVIIIIILLGLWYSGVFSSLMPAPATQPAAVATGANSIAATTMAAQDSGIKTDVAALDVQIAAVNSSITASATPTKQQIATIAANVGATAVMFNKLSVELQSRITNAQTTGASVAGLQAALKDLAMQVSNMTSQAGAASKNVMATSSNSTTITASFSQLKAAQKYAVAARADIQTVLQGLNIK